jgi:hypothetical protein
LVCEVAQVDIELGQDNNMQLKVVSDTVLWRGTQIVQGYFISV